MKKFFCILVICLSVSLSASAQSAIVKDFKEACDSLNTLMTERTSVKGNLSLKAVMKRGSELDFYFTESLGDYPLRPGDVKWFRSTLKSLFPSKYRSYSLGEITTRKVDIDILEVAPLTFDGRPAQTERRISLPANPERIVRELGAQNYAKGLSGRTIALWQSHGRYFDAATGEWIWQRPCLFQTVEDMFTQSFVLPYLVPMLENAGAYVMLPRERDIQTNEVIADNDQTMGGRGTFEYKEKGKWKDAGKGFADLQETYLRTELPFSMGTARMSECTSGDKETSATWRPDIPERGEYAVYVSYKSLPESTSAALYTVSHLGGKSSFVVNQKIGGGTWVYLGTFEFEAGSEGYVSLSSRTPDGYKFYKGKVVTADAVKFGGGMGNIARVADDQTASPATSGMPRSAEAATYWLQWAGAAPEIFRPEDSSNDYQEDFMCRGDWVDWISGGSYMNPDRPGKGVPVDLSLGFHSDAGVTPDDSIVGTLAIYTYKSEGKTALPSGASRMSSREYADLVQSQIVNDIQMEFNPDWNRRHLWDRGYRESRTPSCPAMLLELLSHQNFADMKYGLDPSFRFTVSRAIYKGMLKYLSNRYGVPYQVQPLPVNSLGVRFSGDCKAVLTWKPTEDKLEPTAKAEGYILYTRLDNGAFDTGRIIKAVKGEEYFSHEVDIKPGHIYSFRIAAFNKGGKSFESETVSIGNPKNAAEGTVLIVNNFDRVSGPAFIDTPSYAGFDNRLDGGVPDVRDIAHIGEMYQFRRGLDWISNANPGFGGSYDDYAGKTVAGNTHDFIYDHGKAVMKAGHRFISCSNERFCTDSTYRKDAWALDLVCGKQVTTVIGRDTLGTRYSIFPAEMQDAIRSFTSEGGNVLVSGAYIGTDVWSQIYTFDIDKEAQKAAQKFASNVLGYKWVRGYAGRSGEVTYAANELTGCSDSDAGSFHNEINPEHYCVETPDGIAPAGKNGKVMMRYADTGISAAVCHQGKGYRTVCIGFPIETFKQDESLDKIISTTLEFFRK